MCSEWIQDEEWRTIVKHVPIVSVDLLVRHEGGLLFGKRKNEPVKEWWFLPGGRVRKGESRIEATNRIASEELGLDVQIVEEIGTYDHIYDSSDVEGVSGKHYLATGYVVEVVGGALQADDQHEQLRVFQTPPNQLHQNIRDYLEDASSLPDWP